MTETNTSSIRKNNMDENDDGVSLNAALSGISYGMGIYSLTQDYGTFKRSALMMGSFFFWLVGFSESFTT